MDRPLPQWLRISSPLVAKRWVTGGTWCRDHQLACGIVGSVIASAVVAGGIYGWSWLDDRDDVTVRVQRIDRSVDVGDWRVTLHDVTCGFPEIRDREARGEFCVVSVTVLNRGRLNIALHAAPWELHFADGSISPLAGAGLDAFAPLFAGQRGDGEAYFDADRSDVPAKVVVTAPREKEARGFAEEVPIDDLGTQAKREGR